MEKESLRFTSAVKRECIEKGLKEFYWLQPFDYINVTGSYSANVHPEWNNTFSNPVEVARKRVIYLPFIIWIEEDEKYFYLIASQK